jgi:hypothetical protein
MGVPDTCPHEGCACLSLGGTLRRCYRLRFPLRGKGHYVPPQGVSRMHGFAKGVEHLDHKLGENPVWYRRIHVDVVTMQEVGQLFM